MITENGNRVGEVTFGGSMALVVFVGLPTAMALGVTAAGAEPWLRWTGRLEGLALGMLVLLLFSPVVLETENFDFFILGHQVANVTMIVALFILGGVGTVWLRDRFLRVLPREERFDSASAIYAVLASLGLPALALMLTLLAFDGGAGESLLVASLVVLLVVSSLTDSVARIRGAATSRAIAVLGFGSLIALVAITLPRLVSDIRHIVP